MWRFVEDMKLEGDEVLLVWKRVGLLIPRKNPIAFWSRVIKIIHIAKPRMQVLMTRMFAVR